MTKTELVDAIAKGAGISKDKAKAALEALISAVSSSLKKGKSVTITGFGTFKVSHRAAREGRNPQTGETMKIKATNVPSFKAGKGLKTFVN